MGALFGGAPKPTPLAPVAPPSRSDAEVDAAASLDRKRRRAMLGRTSTNITGDEGVTDAATVGKSLLGGYSQGTGA